MLMVREIDTAAFAALESEWEALLEDRRDNSPYVTWDFMSSWLAVWHTDFDVLPLEVRDEDGLLVGVAGLYVRVDSRRHKMRWIAFMGQRNTYGEYQDILAGSGREAEVAAAVADYLLGPAKRRWDAVHFERLLETAPGVNALMAEMARRRCRQRVVETPPSPFITLGESPDDLLSHVSKNFRGQVRQSVNRVKKLGDVKMLVAPDDVDFDEAFDEFARLHKLRWPEGGTLVDDRSTDFLREFGRRSLERGELFLALLAVDGKTIAARFDYVFDQKLWCVWGGWDPSYGRARPGLAFTMHTLEWGIEKGLTEYDFLAGEQGYKFRWATGERAMRAVQIVNPWSVRGQLHGLLTMSPTVQRLTEHLRPALARVKPLLVRVLGGRAEEQTPAGSSDEAE